MDYNTSRKTIVLPEYGRNVQKMVEHIKTIEDRDKRTEQAKAVVRSMSILNPAINTQQNWEHTLWDQLFIIAGYDLDIDSPYPCPEKTVFLTDPMPIPVNKKPIKATHYGRNIESIIELIKTQPDGDLKTEMIRDLAIYMRTQYLIWNKDSVSDETIFKDIEKLSDYAITVPEGLTLSAISQKENFNRPGIKAMNPGGKKPMKKKNHKQNKH